LKTEIFQNETRSSTKWKWKLNFKTAETCCILRKMWKEEERVCK